MEFTEDMQVQFADFVCELMTNNETFSYYDAFVRARKEYGWQLRYKYIVDIIRTIVKTVMQESMLSYNSHYVHKDGNIFLEFYPEEEADTEEDDDFYRDQAADYDMNGNEDADEEEYDIADSAYDEHICEQDAKHRIYLTKQMMKQAGLEKCNKITLGFDFNHKIILVGKSDFDQVDKNTVVLQAKDGGMHVSVGKMFQDDSVRVIIKDKKILITAE